MATSRLPLPKDTASIFENNQKSCDNAYLLLNKFLQGERKGPNKPFDTRQTQKKLYNEIQAIDIDLTPHKERRIQTLKRLNKAGFQTDYFELKTDSRMVVGLGDSNALEVGLSLHPLYGFPYIPGSSLKGLCRSWLEIAENEFDDKPEPLSGSELEKKIRDESYSIFGAYSKGDHNDENKLGEVTFFDAIPTQKPAFEVDIMNPHYGPYYSNPKENPPGDWYSPVPIKFLTVAPDQQFLFALASRDEDSLKKAKSWLAQGLTELGIGAKTSSGYGFFVHPETEKKRLEEIRKKKEAERPDWAVEMEKQKSETNEPGPVFKETYADAAKIRDLLQKDPSIFLSNAYQRWQKIEDETVKIELAKAFFEMQPDFMEKKKDKKYYMILKEWAEK